MLRACLWMIALLTCGSFATAADKPPVYVWFEPEWFDGVKGGFNYWTGTFQPTGAWGVAGPGISAEWTQGGESEWNSMGAAAEETKAECTRQFVIPRGGKYRVWVRYVDHREATEPFTVAIEQGTSAVAGELGTKPVVSPGDEYALYWGFSFGWGMIEGDLASGPAQLALRIEKPGQAWRQIDAVLITDDLSYVPTGREKPPFAYTDPRNFGDAAGKLQIRGTAADLQIGGTWKRPPLGGRDFSMWTQIDVDAKWWGEHSPDSVTLYDIFYQGSPPRDILTDFHKQFSGRRDLPIMNWPHLLPGVYLGVTPDLSPGTPLRSWLERTKTPFYILTNYASPTYTDETGPATYQALIGPLAEQFLGYIHGEHVGTVDVAMPTAAPTGTRREHVDAIVQDIVKQQAASWSKIYHTTVPPEHYRKGIACLSVDSIALGHAFLEAGADVIGYEADSTNVHVPMRIAFERGAARQYGRRWINYASGNFGDSCNYFTQQPVVPRGAPSWYHSKYAVTDGVSITWYRKMYYLNALSGASSIFWEQGLGNQWFMPGPGTHPIQLTPFGRATKDFQACMDRIADRGEPFTPVAFLLSHGHAYERVNYSCKMLHVFPENRADVELRELFNVAWYPSAISEGEPQAPDTQSIPGGVFGNLFDVLVDRPNRAQAIMDYPVVWAAGDVELTGAWQAALEDYVKKGGTLVVNGLTKTSLPLPIELQNKRATLESWNPAQEPARATTPFEVELAKPIKGAQVLAAAGEHPLIVSQSLGKGKIIVSLIPENLGLDERAHPALAWLMTRATDGLVPIDVRRADGSRPQGEVTYQFNRVKDGWLVLLINNRGVDKTQNGIARVDRTAHVDLRLSTGLAIKSAVGHTGETALTVAEKAGVKQIDVRIPPGDLQVLHLKTE
ncbi:MAG: hypothetical protein AB7O62_23400 [Pirellulales bacterium]